MKMSDLHIGIVHSVIGKNDGVSIVIDQTVKAMVEYLEIPLGNIYFLGAYSPPRFNTVLNDVFWHKNDINKLLVENFAVDPPPEGLEQDLLKAGLYAKDIVTKFIEANDIDILIAHNTCHPYNFTTALGIGMYLEEKRREGIAWPKCLLWWHDSFYEREIFDYPSEMIQQYLKYLPGEYLDGIVFINTQQPKFARGYFSTFTRKTDLDRFLAARTTIIPNTCDVEWDWQDAAWEDDKSVAPPQEQFNRTFFRDIGLEAELEERDLNFKDCAFLLQHTRVVPRKRIDLALELAFRLEHKFEQEGQEKVPVLIISGHSGDEQVAYKQELEELYQRMLAENPESNVIMIFAEDWVLSSKDVVVDRKYYGFSDIPGIIAAHSGIGTYFSEIEGYGNNLLEMVCSALPVVLNRYPVYKSDIDGLGFEFAEVEDCELDNQAVDEAYRLFTDVSWRNQQVKHNLTVLDEKLGHNVIACKLEHLIKHVMIYQ